MLEDVNRKVYQNWQDVLPSGVTKKRHAQQLLRETAPHGKQVYAAIAIEYAESVLV